MANAPASACFSTADSSSRQASASGLRRPASTRRAYDHTHTATLFADISDAVSSTAISSTVHVPFVGILRIVPSAHMHVPMSSGDMFSATSRTSLSSLVHLSSSGVLPRVPYAQKRRATASGSTMLPWGGAANSGKLLSEVPCCCYP